MAGHVHNSSNSTGSSTPQAGSLNHDHHHPMESTTESHHHDSDSPAGPPSHDHKPPSDKPPIISDGSVDHSKHDNTHAQANSEHAGHGGGGHSGGHYVSKMDQIWNFIIRSLIPVLIFNIMQRIINLKN